MTIILKDNKMYLKIGHFYIKMTDRQQFVITKIWASEMENESIKKEKTSEQ